MRSLHPNQRQIDVERAISLLCKWWAGGGTEERDPPYHLPHQIIKYMRIDAAASHLFSAAHFRNSSVETRKYTIRNGEKYTARHFKLSAAQEASKWKR